MKRHLNRCRFNHGLSREKAIQKSPQAFLDCKYKNKISAEYSQSAAEAIFNQNFSFSPIRATINMNFEL